MPILLIPIKQGDRIDGLLTDYKILNIKTNKSIKNNDRLE
jgi:hypothetical protein